MPKKETSPYALEGTIAHEVAADVLQGRAITDNEYLNRYYEYCKGYAYNISGVEAKVKIDIIHGFGTVDFFGVREKILRIVDLKYGKGVKVHAKNNLQLLLYAYGLYMDKIRYISPIDDISMCIYQPRINNISEWNIKLSEMKSIITEIKPKIKAAYTGINTEFNDGPWCYFCPGKNYCGHMRNSQAMRDFKEE
jgi:hypothetical protein